VWQIKERVIMKTTLKERREAFSLTQAQVAEEAGLSLRAYQYFETGKQIPRATTANRLAEILHTSSKEIWGVRKAGR
jgi:DNA-binding XRE family transcriptional regulator